MVTDTERLDWVLKNGGFRVQGSDQNGWYVLDCRNGLTFLVERRPTYREAIDEAMAMCNEGKVRGYPK